MKKIFIILCIFLSLAGCSKKEENQIVTTDSTVIDSTLADNKIDIDLTLMSSTMVYAEVFNIVNSPDQYVGKRIQAEGVYAAGILVDENKLLHFIMIEDATACCKEGLRFVYATDQIFKDGDRIILTGVFSEAIENGYTIYRIEVESISITN